MVILLQKQQLQVQLKEVGHVSQFGRDISTIDRYLHRHRRAYMELLGLKGIHTRLLMEICKTPGCSQDQLTKKIWFDKSTVARQVELLEQMGFVERKPAEKDKRVLCVYPTQQMLDFQPGLKEAMDSWEEALLQDLTPEEKQQLFGLLEKIRQKACREDGL